MGDEDNVAKSGATGGLGVQFPTASGAEAGRWSPDGRGLGTHCPPDGSSPQAKVAPSATAASSESTASHPKPVDKPINNDPSPPPPTAAVCNPSPQAKVAYNFAVRALAQGDPEAALEAANSAVALHPDWTSAWNVRAKALNDFRLFRDTLASFPYMQAIGCEGCEIEAQRAQTELQTLYSQLPAFMERTASGDEEDRLAAWGEMNGMDPTSLHARAALYSDWVQRAARMREAEGSSEGGAQSGGGMDSYAVALQALSCLKECVAEAGRFRKAEEYEVPDTSSLAEGGDTLREFLQMQWPNIPLGAYGPQGVDRVEADIDLNIGLAIEMGADASTHWAACAHYERSAGLDGCARVYTLWAAATERNSSLPSQEARDVAVVEVYRSAVAAGIWKHETQRPVFLIPNLTAIPWHDPQNFAACRRLEADFALIRDEALALLKRDADAAKDTDFRSHASKVLAAGDWCDVGLFYNGMRNDSNCLRAPRTAALLAGDEGGFRRDCTSCSLGSAYFSLLRPHTRLAPHCGPTNARLRAHLGIVVPPGDCEIVVGGETRRWEEGKVVLFDDSFEHAVHNETDSARLVLIMDLWHPELETDAERLAALQTEEQRQAYLGVVERSEYQTTTLRGH